eukprot:13631342-Alexandrium_andersonii.AAC.2
MQLRVLSDVLCLSLVPAIGLQGHDGHHRPQLLHVSDAVVATDQLCYPRWLPTDVSEHGSFCTTGPRTASKQQGFQSRPPQWTLGRLSRGAAGRLCSLRWASLSSLLLRSRRRQARRQGALRKVEAEEVPEAKRRGG